MIVNSGGEMMVAMKVEEGEKSSAAALC
ncbi:hypothetical protein A2U01_0070779, partial [Trifolium medium]|nr:hypothetical protein [Trifolium medium]